MKNQDLKRYLYFEKMGFDIFKNNIQSFLKRSIFFIS